MTKLFTNSLEPDQTPLSVATDQGLCCLPITLLGVSVQNWVKGFIHVTCITPLMPRYFNGIPEEFII